MQWEQFYRRILTAMVTIIFEMNYLCTHYIRNSSHSLYSFLHEMKIHWKPRRSLEFFRYLEVFSITIFAPKGPLLDCSLIQLKKIANRKTTSIIGLKLIEASSVVFLLTDIWISLGWTRESRANACGRILLPFVSLGDAQLRGWSAGRAGAVGAASGVQPAPGAERVFAPVQTVPQSTALGRWDRDCTAVRDCWASAGAGDGPAWGVGAGAGGTRSVRRSLPGTAPAPPPAHPLRCGQDPPAPAPHWSARSPLCKHVRAHALPT